jgi:hypothetical protein
VSPCWIVNRTFDDASGENWNGNGWIPFEKRKATRKSPLKPGLKVTAQGLDGQSFSAAPVVSSSIWIVSPCPVMLTLVAAV